MRQSKLKSLHQFQTSNNLKYRNNRLGLRTLKPNSLTIKNLKRVKKHKKCRRKNKYHNNNREVNRIKYHSDKVQILAKMRESLTKLKYNFLMMPYKPRLNI